MAQLAQKFNLNLDILRHCREQMALPLEVVREKVKSIADIEAGKERPTYEQLDDLSDLYEVPDWVFISESLPEEYRYSHKPSFRSFGDSKAFNDYKFRQLVVRVERYRDLFIEWRGDIHAPMAPFEPHAVSGSDIKGSAKTVREWLGLDAGQHLEFPALRERVEDKDVFVFLTSKYNGWVRYCYDNGWSYIGDNGSGTFRGLAITAKTAPVIIINNSDNSNARSLTLLHELAHLLRGDMNITDEPDSEAECWCNRLAAEILMPEDSKHWPAKAGGDLSEIERLADKFKAGEHDCLARLKELNKISPEAHRNLHAELRQKQRQKQPNEPDWNQCREVTEQFGLAFVRTILTVWHAEDLTITKTARILGLRRAELVYELGNHV